MQSHTQHKFAEQTQTQTQQTKEIGKRTSTQNKKQEGIIDMPEHREGKGNRRTHRHHHLPSFDEQRENEECSIAPLMMIIVCLVFLVQRQPLFFLSLCPTPFDFPSIALSHQHVLHSLLLLSLTSLSFSSHHP